jgi:hypothetical protein
VAELKALDFSLQVKELDMAQQQQQILALV